MSDNVIMGVFVLVFLGFVLGVGTMLFAGRREERLDARYKRRVLRRARPYVDLGFSPHDAQAKARADMYREAERALQTLQQQ